MEKIRIILSSGDIFHWRERNGGADWRKEGTKVKERFISLFLLFLS